MRSYHKHKGCVGSHKISVEHKKPLARTWHERELDDYNRRLGNIKPKKCKAQKKSLKDMLVTLPVDKNGTIIADLTKLGRPIYLKFRARNKKIEMKIESK